ncbi:MAG: acetate--CoA ligase family protein [Ignavibacteriae bacterium]|nr:acetate--CoA ligase family protein [Ignavibacteriota bacterium]
MSTDLSKFFYPKSIAVIGASSKPGTLGYELLGNLMNFGYNGKLFPVNPKADAIHSIKSYKSLLEIKDDVDLAVIMLGKHLVLTAIDECKKKKVKSVIVITAGFKEVGEEGVTLEKELIAKTKKYGMRMLGPNCMGIINTKKEVQMNGTFIKGTPVPGGIGFVSQSGALGAAVLRIIEKYDIGFSQFVSIGNKADVSENDVIDYWKDNDDVNVITVYLESFSDPKEFLRICKEVTKTKPVIAIKAAKTNAGMKAASSHTGALASADTVAETLFEQSGVIRVNTVEDMFNLGKAFDRARLPVGNRVAILTNAGGPAILTVDEADRCGLDVVNLSEKTKKKLREIVVAEASVNNPVDLLPSANADVYKKATELLLADENVDAAVLILGPPLMFDTVEITKYMCEAVNKSNKCAIVVVMSQDEIIAEVAKQMPVHPPIFNSAEKAAWAIGEMLKYKAWKESPDGKVKQFNVNTKGVRSIIKKYKTGNVYLDFDDVYDILNHYKMPIVETLIARNVQQSIYDANKIGFPVVAKVFGRELVHKSDVGGVALNIQDEDELINVESRIIANLKEKGIDDKLEGFILQPFAKIEDGVETILGAVKDANAGHLLMFGLGGIFVEVFKDVKFKIAPLTTADAKSIVRSIKSYEILKGVRGKKSVDIDFVEENILKLSKLVTDFPEFTEIDLNPFVFSPNRNKSKILDARIKLG